MPHGDGSIEVGHNTAPVVCEDTNPGILNACDSDDNASISDDTIQAVLPISGVCYLKVEKTQITEVRRRRSRIRHFLSRLQAYD